MSNFRKSLLVLGACVFLSACGSVEIDEQAASSALVAEGSEATEVDGPAPIETELPPDRAPDGVYIDHAEDGALNGPYWQNLIFSKTDDGVNWSERMTILEHASGPDAITVQKRVGPYRKGDILVVMTYYPENKVGAGELSFMRSRDEGETWTEPSEVTLEGAGSHIPVDPSIHQLEDGTLLLVYQDLLVSNDQHDEHPFYLATSTDGKSFTYQGEIYNTEHFAIHPDIIEYEDTWYLYYATDSGDKNIRVATGEDYMSFSGDTTTGLPGVPGALLVDDQLAVYACDFVGVSESISDDGFVFESIATHMLSSCAPSPVLFDDGSVGVVSTYHIEM